MDGRIHLLWIRVRLIAAALALFLARPVAAQQDLSWDADGPAAGGGGSGNWGTGTPNWHDGASFQVWQNANFDNAVFGGTPGTVVLAVPVQAHSLIFNAGGYRVDGAILTLGGTDPSIIVNAPVATIGASLAGLGGLIKGGPGTLILAGGNPGLTGPATVSLGTLQVSSDKNLGAAAAPLMLDGGTLANAAAFSTSRNIILASSGGTLQAGPDLIVSGTIRGSGSLDKTGAGSLVLAGENTYSGGTAITEGTLQVGDGGTKGSISGNVANNARLVFNRSDSTSYGGVISGGGALEKTGSGMLSLPGDSSGFAGHTTVSHGILSVDGALGGTLHVLPHAHLIGSGHVGGPTGAVAVAGTIAPGHAHAMGSITVHGEYHQLHGSTYQVHIDPAGHSDQVIVTDLADIQGGTVEVVPLVGEYAPGSRFTILAANTGLTGKFDGLAHSQINLDLSYDPTHVYLDVLRFCDMVDTHNQCATGNAAEKLGSDNPIYKAIVGLPDQASVREAFNNLSGEGHASVRGALIEDSRFLRETVWDRIREAFHSTGSVTNDTPGHTLQENAVTGNALWGRILGSFGHRSGDGNASRLNRQIYGIFMGADGRIGEKFLVGIGGGYTAASYDVGSLFSGSSDNYHISVYGGTQLGPLGLRLGTAYIWHDLETSRPMLIANFLDHPQVGQHAARTVQAFGEIGYALPVKAISLEPFARLAYVNLDTRAFREEGGAASLSSARDNQGTIYTTLGVHAAKTFSRSERFAATLRGTIGWRHALHERRPVSHFAFAGGASFDTAGLAVAHNAVVMAAGLDAHVHGSATVGVYYHGQVLHNVVDNGVRANLTWRF